MKQMKQQNFIYHQKRDNKFLVLQYHFKHSIKMECQKITNLLGNIPDKVPKRIAKNGQKLMINLVMHIIDINQANK